MRRPCGFGSTERVTRRPHRLDALILVGGGALLVLGLSFSRPNVGVRAGSTAPALTLPAVANAAGPVAIGGSGSGRVTVVEFFASWCEQCEIAVPRLESCRSAEDVRWVSVSVDRSTDRARETVRRWGLERAVALDTDGSAAAAYGVEALPSTVVIDAAGVVVAAHAGPISASTLARSVQRATPSSPR